MAGYANGWHMNSFALALLLFLFLYNIQFSFLPILSSRIVLLFGVLYLGWLALRGLRISISRNISVVLFPCVLSILYAGINFFVHGFSDASLLKGMALLLLHSAAGGVFFAVLFILNGFDFERIIRAFQAVLTFQAVLIVFYFVSLYFRELNLALIVTHSNIDPTTTLDRARGFAGSYGASLAVAQSLGLIFTAYLVSLSGKKRLWQAYLMASFTLIAASVMLTGRTGLLMLPVVALYVVLVSFHERKMFSAGGLFVLFIPAAVASGYFILKYGASYFPGNSDFTIGADRFTQLMTWISNEVYYADGYWQSTTFNILRAHWFFPENAGVWWFGDPATWSVNRVHSDIGLVRLIFGSGVVGTFLFYSVYVAMFVVSWRSIEDYRQKLLLLLLAVFFTGLEYKEPFLLKLDINSFFFVMFFFVQLRKGGLIRAGASRLEKRLTA